MNAELHINEALSTAHSTSMRHSALLTAHQRCTQHCSLHINDALSTAHSTSTRHSALLTPHQRGTQHCSFHISEALSTAYSTSMRHSALSLHSLLHTRQPMSAIFSSIKVQKITHTPTSHTDYKLGISHALHSLSLHDRPCISAILSSNLSCSHTHLHAHQPALHTQYYPFHSHPLHTWYSWQNGTSFRDGVKDCCVFLLSLVGFWGFHGSLHTVCDFMITIARLYTESFPTTYFMFIITAIDRTMTSLCTHQPFL